MNTRHLPTNIKKLRNTAQPCRMNENEPEIKDDLTVEPPDILSRAAKKHWPRLVQQLNDCGVSKSIDEDAMCVYCETYAQWLAACAAIKKEGVIFHEDRGENKGSIPRISPNFKIFLDLAREIKVMLCEFGLTPSSRTKVKSTKLAKEDSYERWQKRRQIAKDGI